MRVLIEIIPDMVTSFFRKTGQNSKTPVVKKYVEAPVKAVLTVGKRKADGTIGKVASDIKIKYNDDIKHLPREFYVLPT